MCSIRCTFKNRLDTKKQAGPTSLFFGIQAVRTSEFIERTLSYDAYCHNPSPEIGRIRHRYCCFDMIVNVSVWAVVLISEWIVEER